MLPKSSAPPRPGAGKAHSNRHPRRGPRPGWLSRTGEILERVDATRQQYFDRQDVETLFDLRRNAASKLLRQVGRAEGLGAILGAGTRLQANLIARRDLLLFLHRVQRDPACCAEVLRKQRLVEQLAETGRILQARRIPIHPLPPEMQELAGLPPGIELRAGRLAIDFFGAEDLLKHLYSLAQAIMSDYPRFQKICEGD